ncbi:hypothetical protein FsymDg_4254 [Candidatus Protofrankia datiscae]|uniref:Uncharacterized protein n=1 Tax=Candidatus Protofrankia datiscae TaxID=2716812 RepID=F8AXU7_9ACTN|nr:hypothetical protein FsymDg_4254 [Candidatus Protofrankia datiscae]
MRSFFVPDFSVSLPAGGIERVVGPDQGFDSIRLIICETGNVGPRVCPPRGP